MSGGIIGLAADAAKLTFNYLAFRLGFTRVVFWQIVAAHFLEAARSIQARGLCHRRRGGSADGSRDGRCFRLSPHEQKLMNKAEPAGTERLLSVDALRGFAMLWIIGSTEMHEALATPGVEVLAGWLGHSSWHGFRFYDLIFPLFLFVAGVSLTFSLDKQLAAHGRCGTLRRILGRSLILILLGLLYNGGLRTPPSEMRFAGVLQRIALCYFLASLIVAWTGLRAQVLTVAGILVGYWLLMRFVPVPGAGPGVWTPRGNLASHIDRLLLPGRLLHGDWDPEGLLTTLPALATCLLGAVTGRWLRPGRNGSNAAQDALRAGRLCLAGTAGILLGLLTARVFPLNKSLWTSSFVLLTAGLSAVLLSGFHWFADVRAKSKWFMPLAVIGANSIFIYLAVRFVPFGAITARLAGGVAGTCGHWRGLVLAALQLALEWSLLYWLYRRRIFIRI